MRPAGTHAIVAALAIGLAMAGAAHAQSIPQPDADDLGVSENDVRDEADHPRDDNGFPGVQDGETWSPKDDPLILDAYETYETFEDQDLQNLVNVALHGENYEDYDRVLLPGRHSFGAWWGWWSDTGGGGDLQEQDGADAAPFVGPPNGAIDDANDCDQTTWDEFTWRGPQTCPEAIAHPSYEDDRLFSFLQPGTHFSNNEFAFEGAVDTLLSSRADGAHVPDFAYSPFFGDGGQSWTAQNGQVRWTYDSSLLISTSLTAAANPKETGKAQGITTYDPSTPSGEADDHAIDVDVYVTPSPTIEEAYRTAVWDPETGPNPDRGTNAVAIHEDGPKGWAKDDGAALKAQAEEEADSAARSALLSTEPQRGLANDLVQDPFFHEPNQPGDDYNGWATHDPATSYGGLDGSYYEPGPNQAYPGYQAGERFWFDAQVTINSLPYWVPTVAYGWGGTQFTPDVPGTSDPVGDAAGEDETTQGPGILYMRAWGGTWYDGDEIGDADTWVGDAPDHPYANGTVQDPNTYEAEESVPVPTGASGPEWRGTCGVDVTATLYPTSDTDGDGINDWGAAGVYVMGSFTDTNPYSNVVADALGPAADPVLDPLRQAGTVGSTVEFLVPEDDDQLSRYRTTGPIEMRSWGCPGLGYDVGYHGSFYNVILPTGTLDFTFEAVSHAELTDSGRVSQHGDTTGTLLSDETEVPTTITDVDRYGAIVPGGS